MPPSCALSFSFPWTLVSKRLLSRLPFWQERCMTVLSQRVGNFWLIKLHFGPRLAIRPTLRIGPCPVPEKHNSNLKLVLLSVPPSAGSKPHIGKHFLSSQLQLLTLGPSSTLPARSCKSFGEVSVYTSSESIFGDCLSPVIHGAKDGGQLQDLTAGNLGGQISTHKQ